MPLQTLNSSAEYKPVQASRLWSWVEKGSMEECENIGPGAFIVKDEIDADHDVNFSTITLCD